MTDLHSANPDNADQRDYLCAVANALELGDQILINDWSDPLTVEEREQDIGLDPLKGQPADYPYHIIWLSGPHSKYRLHWSHPREMFPRIRQVEEITGRNRDESRFSGTDAGKPVHNIRLATAESRAEQTDRIMSRLITVSE